MLSAIAHPSSEHKCGNQRRDAGTDVNHGPTGKIEGTHFSHPALDAPYPMGERVINKGRPKQNKNNESAEFRAFGKSAGYQSRRNDREHHLVDHESLMGNRRGIIGVGFGSDAVQPGPIQATYEP